MKTAGTPGLFRYFLGRTVGEMLLAGITPRHRGASLGTAGSLRLRSGQALHCASDSFQEWDASVGMTSLDGMGIWDAGMLVLEAHHDRFRFQVDAPDFFHTMLDLVFEGQDVDRCGSAAIDDGEGVFAGDADAARTESFSKAGALDQPGSGNFLASFECRIVGHGKSSCGGALLQILMLFCGKDRVLEERSGALAVGVSGSDEHALAGADVAHGLAGFGQVRLSFAALEVALEVGISDARAASGGERVSDAENDEASALGGVEDAGAVAELASFGTEFAHLTVF